MTTIADVLGTKAQDLLCAMRWKAQQEAEQERKAKSWQKRTLKAKPVQLTYQCSTKPVQSGQVWPLKHICQDYSKIRVECPACAAERRAQ
jgi:hypothetical protein